ncbi:MAG: hypothetical protein NG747_12320 [Candidatus Brocadia sp.]|nr:hypothetical protein [Candidatus Brocadia sp.]
MNRHRNFYRLVQSFTIEPAIGVKLSGLRRMDKPGLSMPPYDSQRYKNCRRYCHPLSPAGGGLREWNGINENSG